jgi:ribosomal-protein-alanine N-acetyltransferase
MPALEPPDPPLADGVVSLRPWSRDDVDAVFQAFQDPELHRWLLEVPDPYSRTDAQAFVVERTAGWLNGSQAAFAIVDSASGRVAGGATLYPDGPGAIAAYWLTREARGRGLATRALRLAVEWGFRTLDLQRITLWTLAGNVRSEHVAERVGFERREVRQGFAMTPRGEMDATLFQLDRTRFEEGASPEDPGSPDRPNSGVPPPDPPLRDTTAGIRLRPFTRTDAPAVARICQDPEIPRWIPMIPRPYTLAHATAFVDANERNWREGFGYEFAIVSESGDELVGSIGLHHQGVDHRAAIGYWVAKEARGRGIATAAVRLVSRWAFDRFRLQRLSLWTLPGNRASQTVAERAGFRYEGILRRWDLDPHGATDVVMFGLTRQDLPDLDAAEGRGLDETGEAVAIVQTPPELAAPGTRPAPYIDLIAVGELPPGTMRRVTLAGIDLLVAHTGEGLVVTDDRCPHMSAPLSIGTLEGCVVACPLHEGRFDLCSGETVRMPTTGGLDADGNYHSPWSPSGSSPKAEPPSKKLEARRLTRVNRLRFYPVRVRDGRIEARLPIVPE